MIVGPSNGGKTGTWKILKNTLNALALKERVSGHVLSYRTVEVETLNPRAMSVDRLYGFYDLTTREWVDGILASILRRLSERKSSDDNDEWKWIVMDGPVDPDWIESMNTVLDDNKVLTLNNGDRITLSDDVLLLFEAEHLENASPATVSR